MGGEGWSGGGAQSRWGPEQCGRGSGEQGVTMVFQQLKTCEDVASAGPAAGAQEQPARVLASPPPNPRSFVICGRLCLHPAHESPASWGEGHLLGPQGSRGRDALTAASEHRGAQ